MQYLLLMVLTSVIFLVFGKQSIRVRQAVNGDHAGGGGNCQKTQSGQERFLGV